MAQGQFWQSIHSLPVLRHTLSSDPFRLLPSLFTKNTRDQLRITPTYHLPHAFCGPTLNFEFQPRSFFIIATPQEANRHPKLIDRSPPCLQSDVDGSWCWWWAARRQSSMISWWWWWWCSGGNDGTWLGGGDDDNIIHLECWALEATEKARWLRQACLL